MNNQDELVGSRKETFTVTMICISTYLLLVEKGSSFLSMLKEEIQTSLQNNVLIDTFCLILFFFSWTKLIIQSLGQGVNNFFYYYFLAQKAYLL